MSDTARPYRFRRAGIALVVGGLTLGVLSFVVPDVLLAGALFVAAVVVRFEQPFGDDRLNLGVLLGLFGALLFGHAVTDIELFDGLSIAVVIVGGGLFELTLGPRMRRYADS